MREVIKQISKVAGPITLSALSILFSFMILQPLACFLDPTFNLLSNRGAGKIAFTILVIYQIILLVFIQSKKFLQTFLETNFLFFPKTKWIKTFFWYFFIFFGCHILLLTLLFYSGFLFYNPLWGSINSKLILRILFGFVATFFLAWTEELIFRGTLYPFFRKNLKPVSSLLLTSLIFMLVHNLNNPLKLISTDWDLGLGLFLLGIILNLIFIGTKKLYTGMGAHAGLVFVKVILRRAPIVLFLPPHLLPFWINKDLRMSLLTHLLFIITIVILAIFYKKDLFLEKK